MSHPLLRTFDKMKAQAKMKEAGKSYADLARALGIKRQAVGHWFRDRGEPDVKQMKAMAKELGCHWLELADEDAMVVYQKAERDRLEKMRGLSPSDLERLDAYLAIQAGVKPA